MKSQTAQPIRRIGRAFLRENFSCKSFFDARRAAYSLRLIHFGRFPDMERITAVDATRQGDFALRPIALFYKLLKRWRYFVGRQGRILGNQCWRQCPHPVWIACDEQHIEHLSVWGKRFHCLRIGCKINAHIMTMNLKHGLICRNVNAVVLPTIVTVNP